MRYEAASLQEEDTRMIHKTHHTTPLAGEEHDPVRPHAWLLALRHNETTARYVAHVLAPPLIDVYIHGTTTAKEALNTDAIVRHLATWLGKPTALADAVWQALGHTIEHTAPETLEACIPEQVHALLCHPTANFTRVLTQALELPQRRLDELETLLGIGQAAGTTAPPRPALPLFQTRPVTPVATGGPMLSSAQALLRYDLWRKDDDGKPVYRRQFTQGRIIEHYITTADPTSQHPEALAGQAAWQIVEQFGIPTAYLHLVFAAYASAQPTPWQGLFRLQGSDLMKTLGMEKRTDITKTDKLREITKQAELLGGLGVWVVWSEGKRDLNVRTSRMWDVAVDARGHKDPGQAQAMPTEVMLTIRPGLWTEKFLNHEGLQAGIALRQFGYLAQETLKINPYHEELAAKLAVYLTIMSRLRTTYQVQTLLAAVESEETLRQALTHRQKRYMLKRRWDAALLTLHEHGWQIVFDPATYPMALRPDWALPEDISPHLRTLPSGYFPQLLAALITIAPPDPIPQLLATSRDLSPRTLPPPPQPQLNGAHVKKARETKGWRQKDLATLLGKSRQWVALIESGRRNIRPCDQGTLRTILGL